jgi:hypothetical protein
MTLGFMSAKDIYEFKENFRQKVKEGYYMEWHTIPLKYLRLS